MRKIGLNDLFLKKGKLVTLIVCIVLLSALLMTPLFAQVTVEASNSTSVSAQVWQLTNDDGQTATIIVQPFTNSGTFTETSDSAGWWMLDNVGNHAFRFNVGGNIFHSSGGDQWDFVNFGGSGDGYQSMGTATGTANGNFPYATTVSGTYTLTTTSGYGTSSGSGTWTGVLVSGSVSSPSGSPSPTPSPTLTPTSTSTPQTVPNDLGSVGLVKGSASLTNAAGQTSINSQSQVGTGTQIQTGSDGIVEFTYPDEGGVVYLGENTQVGWVALQSHPAPDGTVTFTTLPANPTTSFSWGDEAQGFLKWTATGAAIEFLATGAINPYVLGGEIAVHGGAILLRYGKVYINENVWP